MLPRHNYVVLAQSQLGADSVVDELVDEYKHSGQRIMLARTALYELTKGNPAANALECVRHLERTPNAFSIARASFLVGREQVRYGDSRSTIEDREATLAFRSLLRGEIPRERLGQALPTTAWDEARWLLETQFERLRRDGIAAVGGLPKFDHADAREALAPSFTRETLLRYVSSLKPISASRAQRLVEFASEPTLMFMVLLQIAHRHSVRGAAESERSFADACDLETVVIALHGRGLQTDDDATRALYEDTLHFAARLWPEPPATDG